MKTVNKILSIALLLLSSYGLVNANLYHAADDVSTTSGTVYPKRPVKRAKLGYKHEYGPNKFDGRYTEALGDQDDSDNLNLTSGTTHSKNYDKRSKLGHKNEYRSNKLDGRYTEGLADEDYMNEMHELDQMDNYDQY